MCPLKTPVCSTLTVPFPGLILYALRPQNRGNRSPVMVRCELSLFTSAVICDRLADHETICIAGP